MNYKNIKNALKNIDKNIEEAKENIEKFKNIGDSSYLLTSEKIMLNVLEIIEKTKKEWENENE